MSTSEWITVAAIGLVVALVIGSSVWVRSYQRRHPGSLNPGSGSGGILAVFDEIFHPAASESRQLQQVEHELPAPAPLPGDPYLGGPMRIEVPHIIRVSAGLVLDKSGRMLVVRKRGTDVFMQPGGKPEPGETAAHTLARELAEEVGIIVEPSQLRSLGEFSAAAANESGFTVVADVFEVSGTHDAHIQAEIVELRWISRNDAAELGDRLAPLTSQHFVSRIMA